MLAVNKNGNVNKQQRNKIQKRGIRMLIRLLTLIRLCKHFIRKECWERVIRHRRYCGFLSIPNVRYKKAIL